MKAESLLIGDNNNFAVSREQGQTPAPEHLLQAPRYLISFLLGLGQGKTPLSANSKIATKAWSPRRPCIATGEKGSLGASPALGSQPRCF